MFKTQEEQFTATNTIEQPCMSTEDIMTTSREQQPRVSTTEQIRFEGHYTPPFE